MAGEGDEAEDWECEDIVVELHGLLDPDFLATSSGEYRLVGLEKASPVLQIDNISFAGKYDYVMGTDLLFDVPGPGTDGKVSLAGKAFKRLCFERIFIVPQRKSEGDMQSQEDTDTDQQSQSGSATKEPSHTVAGADKQDQK